MTELVNYIVENLAPKALDLGLRVLFAVLFFLLGTQVIKFLRKIVCRAMEKTEAEAGVKQFVDSFIKATLYVVLAFMIATSFGVDAASIVALLGSAGVTIGLAVQGSLSNLAGGVLILLLKPFVVGDYIIESTTGKEGTVAEIQIFYTRLVTGDNQTVILPNGNLANNTITNVTTAHCRRMNITVGISYDADLKVAKEVLQKVLDQDEKTMKDRERLVFVDQLGESSVLLGVRCWFANEDYWEGKWRITEECKYALDAAGISIPYPQMDVHLIEAD